MISLIFIGFLVFWYFIIYITLNFLLYHFKFRSNKFIFDEVELLKLIKDNVLAQQLQPQSLNGSSDSDGEVNENQNGLNTNTVSEHVRDAADTNRVLGALATKYPGHIVESNSAAGGDFIWFNYGGSISKIMVVHASLTELVAIVKFPFGNSSLYSAPLPQETYSFIMKGECLTCTDQSTLALKRNQFEHFFIPTMNAFAVTVPQQCTMLVYARGILPFAIPRLLLDCFFKSLDFAQLLRLLYCISKCTLREIIWNQKI